MQYQQPFDQPLVPNAPYVDGDATIGRPGSIPRGGSLEFPQREIGNVLAAASLTPTSDLTQLAQAMSIGLWLGQMGGTANAITDALPALATTSDGVTQYAIPSLQPGMTFHGIIPATNTGPATLTLTGFGTAPGAKNIVRKDGSSLQPGDQIAGAIASWKWDGAAFRIVGMVASDVLALLAANPTRRNSATLPSTALPSLGAGSWPVPTGVTAVFVQIWAPGGGGGGSGSSSQAGGGAGAGGYVEGWVYIAAGVTALPYFLGSAGVGGNGNTPTNATAGTTTSFAGGALYATGGQPGGTNNGAQGLGGLGYGTNGFSNAYVSNVTGVFTIGGGNGGNGAYLTSDTSTTYGGFGAPSYLNSLIPNTFGGSINGFGPGTGGTGGSRGVGSYLGGTGGAALIRLSW